MKKISYFYNVLVSQYSTEKTVMLLNNVNCVTFIVSVKANKLQIKNVVEKLFNVVVSYVRVVNVKGKNVRFKNSPGKQKDWKKAFVYLNKGFEINFSEFK